MGFKPRALDDNLVFPNAAFFENTAKVVSPGGTACPSGQVVLNLGQPRDKAGLHHRDLTTPSGDFILTGAETSVPYPLDATQSRATDNQLIRLQDGSLLALKNGYTWADVVEPPAWFGQVQLGQTPKSMNGRNAVFLFRSIDCGATWVAHSVIDSVLVENGDFAWPQPPGTPGKPWSVGGFDRSELYQDPWTQTIYVSAHGDGGPFTVGDTQVSNHAGVIFESTDNGRTWSTLRRSENASAPMVMTSTPHHRLIVVREHGSVATLCLLKQDGSWSDDFKIVATRAGVPVKLGVDKSVRDVQPNTPQAVGVARINSPGDPDRVWVAYPTVNPSGKQEYELCIADLFDVHEPVVTHLTTVHAENPANASAILGTFVQNDQVDGPGDWLNYTLFYWIEAPAKNAKTGDQLLARYQVLMGADGLFDPGYLSVVKGQKRLFSRAVLPSGGIGDYFSGGFFLAGGEHRFFAQWVEDVINANVVSVQPFHGPDLFMYKVGDGSVDIDEFVDPPHGTVELWKRRKGWTTGWTSFVPFSMNGGRFLFMYKVGDGTVDIDQLVDPSQGTVQLWQHHSGWSAGWTHFAPFAMNGGQFMLVYKSGVGTVKVEQIVDPTQNPVTLRSDHWTHGWTQIAPFTMNGGQFLFLYKSGTGLVKVVQIVDPAQDTVTLRTDHWTTGWTSIVPIVVNGSQYLFLYKSASGEVKIHQIVDPTQDTIQVRQEHWSSGWTSFVNFVLDGRLFLFCYKAGDGSVAIVAIDDPSQGTVDIWKEDQGWTTGWTSLQLLNQS